jgi:para-aminobenzoate synthetase / 4-amino-4-deoxychorismate lyase
LAFLASLRDNPAAASPAPQVRFDSCDPRRGGGSWEFAGLERVVQAWRVEEVITALCAVEHAVEEGRHAAGFVAYEAAPAFDPALVVRDADPALPLLWFGVFEERRKAGSPAEDAGRFSLGEWLATVPPEEYRGHVARIRDWIEAGDTYQVNHTLRLRADFAGDPETLYRRLCRAQAAAFCAHLDLGSHVVVSASPELFFRWQGNELEMRPMKGTRPRGRWTEEDDRLADELLASAKERAENLMIVDLLRNDAGRISRFGSVRVPRLFEVERYPTVHQLTSTVRAETRPGTTLTDVFRALFPCGSITGAPKVRTTGIIAELEDAPRGVYTGAIGTVGPGEAVFSVAIRTLVIDRRTGTAELGVGGGITHDSHADAEYRECFAKAAFVRHEPREFDLLESLLYEPGSGYFLLDEHLARLAGSARYFGFPCDPAAVRAPLEHAAAALCGPAKVRLLLARGGGVRVESLPLSPVSIGPAAPPSPRGFGSAAGALRVRIAPEPVDSREPLLYHKTTRRDIYDTRRAGHPDVDDVLLVNERGELTESSVANLVVERDGQQWTPPLAAGLLPGVFRGVLLHEGVLRERVLRPVDLWGADAVYLINSVRRWRRAEVLS